MEKYKDLLVWQKSRELVKDVYSLTAKLPESEKYNLKDQIQRAVVSVFANISEGAGRTTKKDFGRFLDIANGSLYETEALLIIANDLDFIAENDPIMDNIDHLQKMIFKLKKSFD